MSALAWGCASEKSPGQPVSGFVTVEGEPLRLGTVTFKPLDRNSGPKVTARIHDGAFELPAEHGPWPGDFQVMIAVIPPDVEALMNQESHEVIRQKAAEPYRVISKEFDAESKLRMTIQPGEENYSEFEVRWARN